MRVDPALLLRTAAALLLATAPSLLFAQAEKNMGPAGQYYNQPKPKFKVTPGLKKNGGDVKFRSTAQTGGRPRRIRASSKATSSSNIRTSTFTPTRSPRT